MVNQYVFLALAVHLVVLVAARVQPYSAALRRAVTPLPHPGRLAAAAGVALVVAAPYWVPYLVDMVAAGSYTQLQAQYHEERHTGFRVPFLTFSAAGLVSLLGLVWMAAAVRPRPSRPTARRPCRRRVRVHGAHPRQLPGRRAAPRHQGPAGCPTSCWPWPVWPPSSAWSSWPAAARSSGWHRRRSERWPSASCC